MPTPPVAGRTTAVAVEVQPTQARRVRTERPRIGLLPFAGVAAAATVVGAVVVFLADESPPAGPRDAEEDAVVFARQVRASDPDELLYHDVELDSDGLVVTVSEEWLDMPYKLRLRMAEKLWRGWAMLHSPDDLPAAPIRFVDEDGYEVGGTHTWGTVWVITEY